MYKLGIDLGGTNIVAGVVDDNYKIIATGKVKTNLPRPAEEVIDDMVKAANMAIESAGLKANDIESMGVGSPGAIDPVNGVVCYANNLGFYNVPMAKMLKERMGVDFYIENDANAAAYGEYIAGAGRGTKNFIAITLGTGVGGGTLVGLSKQLLGLSDIVNVQELAEGGNLNNVDWRIRHMTEFYARFHIDFVPFISRPYTKRAVLSDVT